jgi:peptidoglycan-associated lipoprotein
MTDGSARAGSVARVAGAVHPINGQRKGARQPGKTAIPKLEVTAAQVQFHSSGLQEGLMEVSPKYPQQMHRKYADDIRTRSIRTVMGFVLVTLALVAAGCKHPAATAPSTPAPSATATAPSGGGNAQPTVTLQATPAFVQRGQSSTLQWSSTNATNLTLSPGIGMVAAEGSTTVTPTDSVTYTIDATGPGGTAEANVRITVSAAGAPATSSTTTNETLEAMFLREVKDAYFDLDMANIRPDAQTALSATAQCLRSYPNVKVVIEGHCDERGSTEYNLALGDRRSVAAKTFLESLGVPADRMMTVSYGKEKPFCTTHDETCWQQNRRAHFVMAP